MGCCSWQTVDPRRNDLSDHPHSIECFLNHTDGTSVCNQNKPDASDTLQVNVSPGVHFSTSVKKTEIRENLNKT